MKISKILHKAADKWLWDGVSNIGYTYSCYAVSKASGFKDEAALKFLKSLGCPISSAEAFTDCAEKGPMRQNYRYAWLKFAAMYAEELEEAGEL